MLKSILICCLLALASVKADDDGRIVNGQEIHISQAPHTVQLRVRNGGQFCGGTLVDAEYVVTAAHCFDKISPEHVVVVAGATTTRDAGQQRDVVGMSKPSTYTSANMENDVAILKLHSPMNLNNDVRTVGLCSSPVNVGEGLMISGWGATQSGGGGSNTLRAIVVPAITNADCSERHRWTKTKVTNSMICAHEEIKDACQGDSGGPAVRGKELCGIVSWGVGCASGLPGVYSNVHQLSTFIRKAMSSM